MKCVRIILTYFICQINIHMNILTDKWMLIWTNEYSNVRCCSTYSFCHGMKHFNLTSDEQNEMFHLFIWAFICSYECSNEHMNMISKSYVATHFGQKLTPCFRDLDVCFWGKPNLQTFRKIIFVKIFHKIFGAHPARARL